MLLSASGQLFRNHQVFCSLADAWHHNITALLDKRNLNTKQQMKSYCTSKGFMLSRCQVRCMMAILLTTKTHGPIRAQWLVNDREAHLQIPRIGPDYRQWQCY